jgi:hypothetical protein
MEQEEIIQDDFGSAMPAPTPVEAPAEEKSVEVPSSPSSLFDSE